MAVSFTHLVARARPDQTPLVEHDVASRLWSRLQGAFPDALAVVLMGNHTHVVTPSTDAAGSRARLADVVSGLARPGVLRERVWFEPVPLPLLEYDVLKLRRVSRYVVLNPSRARLVADPLAWPWSTHRDVVGAIESPWVTASRLASALERPRADFQTWWIRYVARDDLVAPGALVLPVAAAPSTFATLPIEAVALAVASATRTRVEDIRRRGHPRELFLALAPLVGWRQTNLLASYCEMSQRAVQESLIRPPPDLRAALLCLGDARLHEAFHPRHANVNRVPSAVQLISSR